MGTVEVLKDFNSMAVIVIASSADKRTPFSTKTEIVLYCELYKHAASYTDSLFLVFCVVTEINSP